MSCNTLVVSSKLSHSLFQFVVWLSTDSTVYKYVLCHWIVRDDI